MIAKRVRQGDMIPRLYGVAWVDYMRDCAVCLPVPLNLAAGLARDAWFWVKFAHSLGQQQGAVRIKVDGEIRTVTVDELVRSFQKNAAADNRLREAARLLRALKSESVGVRPD